MNKTIVKFYNNSGWFGVTSDGLNVPVSTIGTNGYVLANNFSCQGFYGGDSITLDGS